MRALAADHFGIKGAVMRALRVRIGWNLLHALRVTSLFAKPADLLATSTNFARIHVYWYDKYLKKP
jgi:hypothetical protein